MLRSSVVTRPASEADLPVLLGLLEELRRVGGRAERAMSPIGVGRVDIRLLELMAGDDSRVVLACVGEEPAGMAVMRVARPDPLSDTQLVQLAHVIVAPGHRHRGVGHALIDSAATFAVERHLEQVAVSVFPSLREASRFYARLGFAPAALHRVAPAALLRRRLGPDRSAASMGDLVRRRTRRLRTVPQQAEPSGSSEHRV